MLSQGLVKLLKVKTTTCLSLTLQEETTHNRPSSSSISLLQGVGNKGREINESG